MTATTSSVLTINGGSSSIKFSLYDISGEIRQRVHGKIGRIGSDDPTLSYIEGSRPPEHCGIGASDPEEAAGSLIDWLEGRNSFGNVKAIGHRVVHGLSHNQPVIVDRTLLDEMHLISSYDPDHLPGEIQLMEMLIKKYPQIPQVACFDTSFHADLPLAARLLPIPRRFEREGVRRYGFHGISYAYIVEQLGCIAGKGAANGKLIIAHLGSGVSMAAVDKGKCIDTTMGFTPAGGLMMSTRPGDLDPGVAWYMMQKDELTINEFNELINHRCGLLGVSESSADMQELLKQEIADTKAAEAVALFCYHVKKSIGAYCAALGGLETLVFTGGVGENSPIIRSRVCQGLQCLGIDMEENKNEENEVVISSGKSTVTVYAIPTDEESMIAKMTCHLTGLL
jgi:acetate kinase